MLLWMPADGVTTISKWNKRFWCSNYIPDLSGSNCFHCFFPRFVVTSPCSCDIGWSLTNPAKSELDFLECWMCCLGNHWKYPLSSHHHQAGVQSQQLRTLSQWLPGDAGWWQGTLQPTWEGGNWKLAGSITHHPPTQNRRWSTWRSRTRLAIR